MKNELFMEDTIMENENNLTLEDKIKTMILFNTIVEQYDYPRGDVDNPFVKREMEIRKELDEKLFSLLEEYDFFNDIQHKQGPFDNVISLMKIVKRLNLEMPNVQISTLHVEDSYDEMWEGINKQIPMTPRQKGEIRNFASEFLSTYK